MKYIQLTKGKTARVCDCHYDLVKDYHWQYHENGYAITGVYDNKGVHHIIRMHRIINNTTKGYDTDHINQDKLDNRCLNLRAATRSENNLNSKLRVDNTSGVKGITWDKINNKWAVQLCRNGKTKKIGRYTSIEAAQEALDAYRSHIAV